MFDRVDRLDLEEYRALEGELLHKLTSWASRRSPFYRSGLRPVRSRDELTELPLLTPAELVEHRDELMTGPLERAVVFKTGGTTGAPKFNFYSHADYRRLCRTTGRTLWASGLRPGDKVANLFAPGELYASFLTIHRGIEEVGAVSFPFTFHAPWEQVLATIPMFGINTLMGLATQMVRLGDEIVKAGLGGIDKVFYAAEHLYPEDRSRLEETLAPRLITTAGYGAVDAGMVGTQCPGCHGSVHHELGGAVVVEILDTESGRPVGEGEVGRLVVTSLERYLMPIIRYPVGDLARWVEGPCPCGRPWPRFELLGRGDDQLRIGYDTVTYQDLLAVSGSGSQMVKRRLNGKDLLILRVEGDASGLREGLLERKPLLARHIAEGYTHDLTIEVVESLPRDRRTGKLKRVLDESL